ncbi:hypothetical protein [Hamadaea tsunoensis]|uniref:hypothetical protein n=1 Tax=Hamadaea tsunoensis TaxID=53368 RepID=UPI00041F56CC|nr:hypothetical protein [Hamadaea tsunoensis]
MNQSTALARLRAADPAADLDPGVPSAVPDPALLTEIAAEPARRSWLRSPRRRWAAAGTAVAAAVAVLFVSAPWSAAYAVEKQSDGTVAVSFDAARLGDPGRLNRDLARAGARTVVMRMVSQADCPTPRPTPGVRLPVDYRPREDGVGIVVRPWEIPPGDILVFGYAIHQKPGDRVTLVRPMVVHQLPSCIGEPTPRAEDVH